MWMGSHPMPKRKLRPDKKVPAAAKPPEFEPTVDDLRNVRAVLAREIERLQGRLAEIDQAIAQQ